MKVRRKPKTIRDLLYCLRRKLLEGAMNEPLIHIRKERELRLRRVKNAIRRAWCRETCYPPTQEIWSEDIPERGQCAVTAMVMQDYMGGDILYCSHTNHYWNRLSDGREVDLTRSQFPSDLKICFDEVADRQRLVNYGSAMIMSRYSLLKHRVERLLESHKKLNAF
ncbi:MAG: hypothetical protein QW112_01880 [Candidatus Micrarchaeia archaeon]